MGQLNRHTDDHITVVLTKCEYYCQHTSGDKRTIFIIKPRNMRVGNSQETEDIHITTNIEGREVSRILAQ